MRTKGVYFLTNVSIPTARIVSFGIVRFSLHETLWYCLFLSESTIFGNSCVIFFQSDFISIAKTENYF